MVSYVETNKILITHTYHATIYAHKELLFTSRYVISITPKEDGKSEKNKGIKGVNQDLMQNYY
jgi:hypothetical protein